MTARSKPAAVLVLLAGLASGVRRAPVPPPPPAHSGDTAHEATHLANVEAIARWTPEAKNNAWEMSGLYEGDIMMDEDEDFRNVVSDQNKYWAKGIVPYYIEKKDFTYEQIQVIHEAMGEYHDRTCIKFRPYREGDENYLTIKGDSTGCWSYIGCHGGGQVVNLQVPGCTHHGIVTHEFLHALGFYHQHSAFDRDDYIKIHYENIKSGHQGVATATDADAIVNCLRQPDAYIQALAAVNSVARPVSAHDQTTDSRHAVDGCQRLYVGGRLSEAVDDGIGVCGSRHKGKEHNFRKYNATAVTDFKVGYDYKSIMHYSAYAFSKNGEATIEPLDKEVKIGQRKGLSRKDIQKLAHVYKCTGENDFWSFY